MILDKPCHSMQVRLECPQASIENPVSIYGFLPGQEEELKYARFIGTVLTSGYVEFSTDAMPPGSRLTFITDDGEQATGTLTVLGLEHVEQQSPFTEKMLAADDGDYLEDSEEVIGVYIEMLVEMTWTQVGICPHCGNAQGSYRNIPTGKWWEFWKKPRREYRDA